ncbi:ATP-binding protein [Propionivibrio limicola]|uniref:ATP-binding protein n=1 Tax=Propionivibrio limicola TaxID=167645 RepID=UPI0012920575|nr:ATP-binding protein [Propionivibrio limicola]
MIFRPASLTAQLSLLLVAGIAAAHLIGVLINVRVGDELHPIARNQAIERVVVATRLLATCGTCDRELMLRSLSTERVRFSMQRRNPLADRAMDEREAKLADQFVQAGDWPPQSIVVSLNERGFADDSAFSRGRGELVTALRFGEQWLVSVQHVTVQNRWWRSLVFSLADRVLPVLLLVVLFTRWLLRPLRDLERAAMKMSHGVSAGPLLKRGPRELQQLIGAFNSMHENLARHVRDRTCLLASVSHDLRTPITSLRIRAELVEDGANKNAMLKTITQLQRMVDEALSFLRGEACQEKREEFDLSVLLEELVAQRTGPAQRVSCSGPPTLPFAGYPLALSRALGNLLDNALRHGSQAAISLSESPRRVEIRVTDDGPGIPQEFHKRVFEPFFRLPASTTGEHENVGLGLSIVRSCVQRHGGSVCLENMKAGGLQVTIRLPRQAPSESSWRSE